MKVSYGQHSSDVAELQDLLRSNGFDPGPKDGIFGDMTKKALNQFQASMGYPISNMTDAATFDALRRNVKSNDKAVAARANQHVPVAIPGDVDPITRMVLEIAISQIGVEEMPLGTNSGPSVNKYTNSWRVPWCAAFVSWVINETPWYKDNQKKPLVNPYIYAVVKWKAKLEEQARYHTLEDLQFNKGRPPQPGDIFIILYSGADGVDTGHGHTGFIVSYDPETKVAVTCEGNTSNGVRSRYRKVSDFSGWGRPLPMPA